MLIVLIHGAYKGVAVYDAFVEGAKNGLMTVLGIFPYLCGAMLLIALVRASGLMDVLVYVFSAPLQALGLPSETLPLLFMRPVSGSASLAVLEDILHQSGPDSQIGRVASTMMGSTETVLYTVAVYLGAAGIKKSRGIMPVALLASLAGAVAAGLFVRLLY